MSNEPQRIIVIVGRPNVGKSALFNRIVGRRLAIVHEESGVTRDRLAAEATWDMQRFEVIDTGGLAMIDRAATSDCIEDGIRRQVEAALEDAAVLIVVTDLTAGITPLDREVAKLLHESGRTVLLAANKADNDNLDSQAAEFESLGFPAFPISAIHDRGIEPLMDAAVEHLPAFESEVESEPLKVAVVGRPNAGKSSYINRLLKSDRVIVSEVPGTTRDSVEIPFSVGKGPQARRYLLIDTAGMRYSRKVKTAVDKFSLIRAEKSIQHADVVVLMFDATEGPSTQDKKIASKIIDHNKGCIIMVSKWDLADEVTQRAYGKALYEAVPFLSFVPTVFLSAKSGYNIRKSIEAIDHVASQVRLTLSTGILNRVLHDATTRVQPPSVGGRRMKFYYATQTGTQPVRVRLFVNDPRKTTPAYRTYLIRQLREAYGLEGAPIVLEFRSRPKGD